MEYIYKNKLSDIYWIAFTGELPLRECKAVRRSNGKCIRAKNGSMLVEFEGRISLVIARNLRKIKSLPVQLSLF
jgi:hypothetical protein